MKIVVSEFMDEAALDAFAPGTDVIYDPTLVDDRERLLAGIGDTDALIVRNRTQVDTALLNAATALRVVGRLGVGLDNIDMDACTGRGVTVHPATGANALAVAEYVITNALMLRRRAYTSTAAMLAGEWPRNALIGAELSGATMGLVGFGNIARTVAERAQALGMETVACDPHLPADDRAWEGVMRMDLPGLLARADVVSLHIPLTDATRNLIDADALTLMKPGAILINTARGGTVDEAALSKALRTGSLGGAALDVFETEPLTEAAARIFKDAPNLLLTPHIAGVTREANSRVSAVTVARVIEALGT